MIAYTITKFNPDSWNDKKRFNKENWTSISDIGKSFRGKVLNYEDYVNVEDSYIEAIKLMTTNFNLTSLFVKQFGRPENNLIQHFIDKYKAQYSKEMLDVYYRVSKGSKLNIEGIQDLSRLFLRENLWGELRSRKMHFIINIGYDYLMCIECPEVSPETIQSIEKLGLYVEPITIGHTV